MEVDFEVDCHKDGDPARFWGTTRDQNSFYDKKLSANGVAKSDP